MTALTITIAAVRALTPEQRRGWFIKMKLDEKGKTLTEVARRHRFSTWLLAAAVNGKASWSRRVVRALQAELKMDLRPFLTKREADRL